MHSDGMGPEWSRPCTQYYTGDARRIAEEAAKLVIAKLRSDEHPTNPKPVCRRCGEVMGES